MRDTIEHIVTHRIDCRSSTMLTLQIVTLINFVARAFREKYIYRVVSQNYKNDAAIVNLCSHEFIVAVPEIFERGCAIFSVHRDMFQDYGD